ncbi:3-oxoacyl-[acyl-carrier-protein] synthase III C-terminal domain-containing protein [Saccharothrix sp.]|uniref:3-oxoacyl-[acyl-carrier-protein] synthase III C-terminal domain-containing protein n=1 Tax=Saccharothrix sp. TaxID=1873460 RepID=UPI002810B929|nr:3-oxoacyl-[acyl-carrier-protein] synthase III C-terminal domain-containing protein [Saccharothrix sp.]
MSSHHCAPRGERTAAVLCGVGAATPTGVVTNHDPGAPPGATDDWISSRTGVTTRHVTQSESTEDLAVVAATRAPPGRPGALATRGQEAFRHAVDRMTSASIDAASAARWRLDQVDRFVPHQANGRITDFAANRLPIPDRRRPHDIETVGNTGAASIPLLLAHTADAGNLVAGHRLLRTAFGAGPTRGAATLTWPDLT